jgi:PAS domain S-box-containing protein
MDVEDANKASPEELAGRFGLLAAGAREYALYLVDLDGRLLCWNLGAERLFGYQANEVAGKHFSRFFLAEDIRTGQPEYELKAALEEGQSHSVRWQVRKDGSQFWCQATTTALLDEKKQVRSFARVMHDLTESEKQLAEKHRADALSEANRSKEEFMALLAHELRNPLSPILHALNILRRMKTDDPIIAQAGNIIGRQVGQMVRLVDDLLDISRITKGKLQLRKELVDVRVGVNRAAESVRPLLDARKHEFSLLLPTEPIWMEADPARLEQITVNLLNNAAKYTDPGGLIVVGLSREGDEAVLTVKDNGVGIDPAMLPRVFDLFTQVEGSVSRSHGGLGIGLALVSALVEMHGGRVQACSAGVDKGSEFTVKLPVLADALGRATKTVLEPKEIGRPLRVLVVEDNADAADGLSLLLRLYGHEVWVARSGTTVLEMALAFRPQVVLLDIGLPGMDGYHVAQCLREHGEFKNVTLCALTGYTPSEADRQRHQEFGFDYYFVKPVSLEKLTEMFKSVAE